MVVERADVTIMPTLALMAYPSSHTKQAMNCMHPSIDLSKAYESNDMPLAWHSFGTMGNHPNMLQAVASSVFDEL